MMMTTSLSRRRPLARRLIAACSLAALAGGGLVLTRRRPSRTFGLPSGADVGQGGRRPDEATAPVAYAVTARSADRGRRYAQRERSGRRARVALTAPAGVTLEQTTPLMQEPRPRAGVARARRPTRSRARATDPPQLDPSGVADLAAAARSRRLFRAASSVPTQLPDPAAHGHGAAGNAARRSRAGYVRRRNHARPRTPPRQQATVVTRAECRLAPGASPSQTISRAGWS